MWTCHSAMGLLSHLMASVILASLLRRSSICHFHLYFILFSPGGKFLCWSFFNFGLFFPYISWILEELSCVSFSCCLPLFLCNAYCSHSVSPHWVYSRFPSGCSPVRGCLPILYPVPSPGTAQLGTGATETISMAEAHHGWPPTPSLETVQIGNCSPIGLGVGEFCSAFCAPHLKEFVRAAKKTKTIRCSLMRGISQYWKRIRKRLNPWI